MKRKIVLITISILITFLIVVTIYTIYIPDSEEQNIVVSSSAETTTIEVTIPETTQITTEIEIATTSSPPATTTAIETAETTAEIPAQSPPTLRLIVYEGPVIVQEDELCYYRVEAIVTGDPYPAIRFSRDDSNGVWGKNKAQVNLRNGESYVLVVTATNTAGEVTEQIELTWSP